MNNEYTAWPQPHAADLPLVSLDGARTAQARRFLRSTVDPVSGYAYEARDAGACSGFYRFVPDVPDRFDAGGSLYMLKITGSPMANLGARYPTGVTFDVEWVPIDLTRESSADEATVWADGRAQGAAVFSRLEGCWHASDRRIYIIAASDGDARGQIWAYDPGAETITLLFQSARV